MFVSTLVKVTACETTHCPKMNRKSMWEVKKNSGFLSTEHGSCHLAAARRRETMVAKCELVL